MQRYFCPLILLCIACGTSAARSQGVRSEPANLSEQTAAQQQTSEAAPHAEGQTVTAPDPTVSDGDKYQVILENEHVRVLRYRDAPGDKTHQHHHPHPFIMYALAPFRRELTFPDGTRRQREFGLGTIDWVPAQTHVGQNIGDAPTEGLIVEVKSCVPNDATPVLKAR